MNPHPKHHLPLLLVALALLGVLGAVLFRPSAPVVRPSPDPVPAPPPSENAALSMLASPPDWSSLEPYQRTITRTEFEQLLTTVFTTGDAWRKMISISEEAATIRTGEGPDDSFLLQFAPEGFTLPVPRHWRGTHELPAAPVGRPLDGLRIAIDPGHIGGEWAKMEERWFVLPPGTPVKEGDMTLLVARLLKPLLEDLGATVSLVREKTEPVTPVRPDGLESLARESAAPADSPEALQRLAQRLFYRTAEIRARAHLVNTTLRPDLVLCLHFNAEGWGDPLQPVLVDRTHLHLILNGAYNDEEVGLADQRYAMLRKLLQRTHREEALVGATVADTFAEISGLPPYIYPAESKNARPVAGHPYLWARNLLANRLYDCPVVFMEPYVMNSTRDYARIQAGDYEGLREIDGRELPSIFREYARAMATGLARHYTAHRSGEGKSPPTRDSR